MTTEMDKYGRVDMHVWYTMKFFEDDPIRKTEIRENIYTMNTMHPTTVHNSGVHRWVTCFQRDNRFLSLHIKITEPNNSDNVFETYQLTRNR
jgi:hypothetical protein